MAIDFQQAVANYGYVAVFAQSNPEVAGVLNTAVQQEWDSARFQRALMDTNWWKSTDETRRTMQTLQSTDPATYNAQIAQKASQLTITGRNLGLSETDWNNAARLSLENGWNAQQEQEFLVNSGSLRSYDWSGGLTGQAGEVEAHIRATAAAYGMPMSDAGVQGWVRNVLNGGVTTGGLDNEVKTWAKKAYPPFADEIDAGKNMLEIADPYIQTMSNTLETASTDISLSDPSIKKALAGTNGQPMALWDFERTLKDDPRWDKTKQARNETYATLQQIGKDFGFGY